MAGAGYHLFVAGAVLTAAQVNTFLNEQSVMVFASAAARDAALASAKSEGMFAYLLDADLLTMYNSAGAWEVAFGVRSRASAAVSGVGNGGLTGVLGAPSFVAVAGHRYKITISWGATVQVGAGVSEVQIHRGLPGTTLITTARNVAAGTVPGGSYVTTDVPGAGAVVYVLYTFTTATTVQLQSNYEIIVEDIGQ